MIRAAVVDLVVETGADFTQAFSLFRPTGVPVRSQDVIVGDRFYLDGYPEKVATVERQNDGTLFRFREGLWWQPRLWLPDEESVMPAMPMEVLAVESAWSEDTVKHPLPASTLDSGRTVVVEMDDAHTLDLGAYVGTWPWDLYVSTVDGKWIRLAGGSMSVIRGDARQMPVAVGGVLHGAR